MRIQIYPLSSVISKQTNIDEKTEMFLDDLMDCSEHSFEIVNTPEELYDGDLGLILILTGGAERMFLNSLPKLKAPYYILTYGLNNSLAASIEILSYLNNNNLKGEILHGQTPDIAKRIDELLKENNNG